MQQRPTVMDLLREELPPELTELVTQALRKRASRGLRRIAADLASVLANYARMEQDATTIRAGGHEDMADRNRDLKSSLATQGMEITQFCRLSRQVRREWGEELWIQIRSAGDREAQVEAPLGRHGQPQTTGQKAPGKDNDDG